MLILNKLVFSISNLGNIKTSWKDPAIYIDIIGPEKVFIIIIMHSTELSFHRNATQKIKLWTDMRLFMLYKTNY